MVGLIAASAIAATAFRLLRLAPISSFADDSQEAADAAAEYAPALAMALGKYDWSFARETAQLPLVSGLPNGMIADSALPYVFALPGDCVRVRLVLPEGAGWRIEGLFLLSDSASVSVRFTRRIDNEKLLSQEFQTYVAFWLAQRLSHLSGSDQVADRVTSGLIEAERVAIDADRYSASSDRADDLAISVDWVSEALR